MIGNLLKISGTWNDRIILILDVIDERVTYASFCESDDTINIWNANIVAFKQRIDHAWEINE